MELVSVKNTKWFGCQPDEWLRYILGIHFDPCNGSKYWLERERALNVDIKKEISCLDELRLLGPMRDDDLRRFPVEDFIPRRYLDNKSDLILGETSGTTGKPKVTAYKTDEFISTFVDYFGFVAEYRGFPSGGNWLWVGPSGPHIIGKAVGLVAKRMNSMDPFSVDFDPRWAKKIKEWVVCGKTLLNACYRSGHGCIDDTRY